jgi:predicted permease
MGFWSRLTRTIRTDRHHAEIREELEFHLAMDAADGRDRRQTRLRLGNLARITEETRAMGILEWLESAAQDVRYGARQFVKAPAVTLAVTLSLAVGVGANTAIFSLIDAALLKPLPVADPDSLVILEWTNQGFPIGIENHNGEYRPIADGRHRGSSIGVTLYRGLAREQTVFEPLMGVGAYPYPVAIAVDSAPAEQVSLQYVSGNFFHGMGVPPIIGRSFREDDDRVGAEPVVVVSHRFWVSRLGRSPDALARTLRINTVPARIVGVAPPEFFGMRAGQWPDVYAPLATNLAFQPAPPGQPARVEDDRNWWIRPLGRLKPGIPEAAARAQIATLFRGLAAPQGAAVEANRIPELVTMAGRRGFEGLSAADSRALWILMLLVAVLLLIVCANVANLLLSRSVGRQRESAMRLALGAARTRLFRQHLLESTVPTLLGGVAGVALGYGLAQSIHLLFHTGRDASSAFDLRITWRILAFSGALSMLTALLFGLAPAARASRAEINETLKTHTRSIAGQQPRLPRMLVSIQIALCLAALTAAGLLMRSLDNLKWIDLGFDRDNLAYASVSPSRAGYSPDRIEAYVDRARDELARIPGVVSVSPVQTRLLSGGGNGSVVNIPGQPYRNDRGAHVNLVGDDFFETLRIPLVAGRAITRRDLGPDIERVVVDDLFARRYFPGENPIGRWFGLGPNPTTRYEIVGVVAYSRYNSLRNDAFPAFYQPYRAGGTVHFAIRSTIDPARLAESVRQAIAAVDPAVAVTEFHTQSGLIDRTLRTERLLGFLSAGFGAIALILAATGLGGLLAYSVARRVNEIGVRMALGADRRDVVRLILRDSVWMVGSGILIGLPCAFAVGRLLRHALFRLEPLDPLSAALACLLLLMIAMLAAWIPARRATRIDPVIALREG